MKRYQYEQLDADTKAYLRFVRDGQGRGAPGIYFPFKSNKPTWALIAGLVVLPLFFYIGYTSSKAGWAAALLQTAGVLLGGWLIVFAIRRWMANPDKSAGHFVYFDPEYVYYGMGEEIQIAKVGREPDVEPRGENMVRFDTERGAFTVPTVGRVLAQFVTDFYEALKWVQSREEGPWVDLNSAEAGAVARFLVEEDREPSTLADTGVEVEEIPNQVSPVSEPSFGLVRYATILGIGVIVFALFAFTNPSIQDDMAFEQAKEAIEAEKKKNLDGSVKPIEKGFTGAYAVRDYLLNPKNVRHRAEAEKLLSDLYTGPIQQIQTNPVVDARLRPQVLALLESLRKAETPAVSFRITVWSATKNKDVELGGDEDEIANRDRGKQVQMLFADGFASAIGKDLALGVAAPAGRKAHIEVKYKQSPRNPNTFEWEVEIRTVVNFAEGDEKAPPEANRFVSAKGTATVGFNPGAFNPNPFGGGGNGPGQRAYPDKQRIPDGDGGFEEFDEPLKNVFCEDDAVYRDVMQKIVGQAPMRPVIQ